MKTDTTASLPPGKSRYFYPSLLPPSLKPFTPRYGALPEEVCPLGPEKPCHELLAVGQKHHSAVYTAGLRIGVYTFGVYGDRRHVLRSLSGTQAATRGSGTAAAAEARSQLDALILDPRPGLSLALRLDRNLPVDLLQVSGTGAPSPCDCRAPDTGP